MVYFVGIDYSITSPAICIGKDDNIEECQFFYVLENKKKPIIPRDNFYRFYKDDIGMKKYKNNEERFDNISNWVYVILQRFRISKVFIEGYSYGSKGGLLFNIAENGGILKHKLWKNNYNYEVISPNTIKKFATGKGNANKEKMNEVFVSQFGIDLKKELQLSKNSWNPSSDIIDSYYILSYGISQKK